MKKILSIVLVGILCVGLCGCSTDTVDQITNVVQSENENVLLVKNGTNDNYPDVTYGDAFEEYFKTPTWKYFKGTQEGPDDDEDGKPDYTNDDIDVVEFTGHCMYKDVEVKALIQFTLDKDASTFTASYLSFNDVPQSSLMLSGLLRVQDICECSVSNLGDSNGVSRQGTIFPYNDCGCSRTT